MGLHFPAGLVGRRAGVPAPLHFWDLDDADVWNDKAGDWAGFGAPGFSYGTSNGDPPNIGVDAGVGPGGQAMARWDNNSASEDHEYLQNNSGYVWQGQNGNDMTFSGWQYMTAFSNGNYGSHLLDITRNANMAGAIRLFPAVVNGSYYRNRLYIYDDTGVEKVFIHNPTVSMNVWNHFLFTVSGQTVKLYVNGVQRANVTNTSLGNIHTFSRRVTFGTTRKGAYQPQYNRYRFNDSNPAYMGMFGFWDVALKQKQVDYLYNGGAGRSFDQL